MIEIGAIEAKDKFSRLLDRVQLGEEIVITRRGRPIAKLGPDTGTVAGSRRSPRTGNRTEADSTRNK